MAKKPSSKRPVEASFIVASLRDYRLVEEHAKLFPTSGKPGEAISVNAQSTFGIEVGIGTGPDEGRMILVINASFLITRIGKGEQPLAEVTAKQLFNFHIERIIGELDLGAIPMSAIQPYAQLAAHALLSRARDLLARMGLPNVPIKVPEDFSANSLLAHQKGTPKESAAT